MWKIVHINKVVRPTTRELLAIGLLTFSYAMLVLAGSTFAAVGDQLLHNSNNLGTKYGVWGVAGGKYGQFTCTTCHSKSSGNVKRVATTFTAPLGSWSSSKAATVAVVFNNMTGFGNDAPVHTTSTMVCQVCHSKTVVHRYNKPVTQVNSNHQSANNTDCTQCHKHANAFAPSGHLFPSPGASHMADAGTTPWPSCNGCHVTSGNNTYPVAVGVAPDCTGCHKRPGNETTYGLRAPSGTSSCYDCHGTSNIDGRPNGSMFPNYSGSHTKHVVNQGFACSVCHVNGGTGSTNHGSSNRTASTDITFVHVSSASAQFHFVATGKGTCSTNACHATVQWGSKLQCNSCHSYLATDPWNTTYGVQGIGAHVKHINYIMNRWPGAQTALNPATDSFGVGAAAAVCGVCHTINPADHSMNKSNNTRKINFGGSASRSFGPAPFYNGSSLSSSSIKPKSCSNTDCHYKTSPIWNSY